MPNPNSPVTARNDDAAPEVARVPVASSAAERLIGRTREWAELRQLVSDPASPLVVITGPGGIGKSRLALAIAQDAALQPAVFVELGRLPAGRADLVVPTIAASLGIPPMGDGTDAATLAAAIGSRRLLLVLDGMEHLVEAGPLLTGLLRHAPQLSILATSQTVLDLYGEQDYPLAPLTYPPEDDRTGVPLSLTAVLRFDAVLLFVQRAFDPGADGLSDDDVAPLLAIARRLEGHPLAIELAAAHVRSHETSLAALADLLRDDVAASGLRPGLGPLMQTLARSYARLTTVQQEAFRRASLLGGVWTIADAVPVLGIGDENAATFALMTLLDASLLHLLPATQDHDRMQMLEPLRLFGWQMLGEAGEREATEERLAASVLRFAERAAPELTGEAQADWLDRVDERLPDIRRAIGWFREHDRHDELLRLVNALWRFGYTRGHLRETVSWLEMALVPSDPSESDTDPEPMRLRGRAWNALGLLVGMRGDRDRAMRHYERAYGLGTVARDANVMGGALLGLGEQTLALGDRTAALDLVERGLLQLARGNDRRSRAVGLTNLANMLWSMGRLDEAYALNREARALYTGVGDRRGIAWSITNLGRIALQRGDLHEAVPLLQDALQRSLEPDDRFGIAETFDALARCALAMRDAPRAALISQVSDRLRSEIAFPVPEVDRAEAAAFREALAAQLPGAAQPAVVDLEHAVALALEIVAPEPPTVMDRTESVLSPREMDVLRLIQLGLSNQEIADSLFIGIRTVQSHVLRLMRKLDASSRVAAVAIARQRGLLGQET